MSNKSKKTSRKFFMGLLALLLTTAVTIAMIVSKSFGGEASASVLAAFVAGIMGVYGTYCGMNVSSKFVTTRKSAQPPVMED